MNLTKTYFNFFRKSLLIKIIEQNKSNSSKPVSTAYLYLSPLSKAEDIL
jgi:hypothetical protein